MTIIKQQTFFFLYNDSKMKQKTWMGEKEENNAQCQRYTLYKQGPYSTFLAFLNPHTTLPVPLRSPLSATAASRASPSLTCGRQVLIDGPAVGDKTHAKLEVSGQSAVRSQSQDQEGGQQQEAHHKQSHAASIVQQVWAVEGRPVGLHLRKRHFLMTSQKVFSLLLKKQTTVTFFCLFPIQMTNMQKHLQCTEAQGFVYVVWRAVPLCRQKSQQASHSCKKLKLSPSEVWDGEIKSQGKHSTGVPEFSSWLTVYIPSYPNKTQSWFSFLDPAFFFQNTSAYIQKKEKHLQGGSYCGVAEKAKCDHGQGRGEDGAKHNAGHQAVDQSNDQILCGDQHWTRPAVQRAP